MKQQFLMLFLLSFAALCFSQLTFSLKNQCSCNQYSQFECSTQQTNGFCSWNSNGSYCAQSNCSQLYNQAQCLSNYDRCSWDGTNCNVFSNCTNLNPIGNLTCIQQNLKCIGNNSTCQEITQLPSCNSYSFAQCGQNMSYGYGGKVCVQQNNTCVAASQCSQINNQDQCNQQKFSCQWNYGTCVQQECYQLTPQNCQFVILNLDIQTIQKCTYLNGFCTPVINTTQLNSQTCSTNTLQNYHWIQSNSTGAGLCIPCSYSYLTFNEYLNYYNPNNECACGFFTTQSSCNEATKCFWNNGTSNCQAISCEMITNQLSCISNTNCQWNNGCYSFNNCPTYVQSKSDCLLNSFNCKAYNPFSQQCVQPYQLLCNQNPFYNSYYCEYYSSGQCYFNSQTNQCLQTTSCSQLSNEQICNSYPYACMWQEFGCKQLKCQYINEEKYCKFVVINLQTNDIEPCVWNSNTRKCSELIYQSDLNQNNCQENSLSTFYWSGSQCLRCNQTAVNQFIAYSLPNQCTCNQIKTENECTLNNQCMWYQQQCLYQSCQQYTVQNLCATNPECVWQNNQCRYFSSCSNLNGQNQQECLSQSINCLASNGQTCQSKLYLRSCDTYTNSAECQLSISKDGLCLYNQALRQCQLINSCSSIQTQQQCSLAIHQCIWISDYCQVASCSSFKTQYTCSYYTASFSSTTAVPCVWNSSKNVCVQASTQQDSLTQLTCYQNTARTSRWLPSAKSCISCQKINIPNQFQCSCSQLNSQINCQQMRQCVWSIANKVCTQIPCKGLDQQNCVINSQCMWLKNSCTSFIGCSSIPANGYEECLASSLYCPIYNYQTQECQSQGLYQQIQCQYYYDQATCSREHPYYKCYWNSQNKSCELISACQQMSQQQCAKEPQCISNIYGECQNKQCQDYTTSRECTYVLNFSSSEILQSCIWVLGTCQNKSSNYKYDPETCFTNTAQTSRWSQNTDAGYCISCLPTFYPIKPSNQCVCSQLLNQYECQRAGCGWNQTYCEIQCINIDSQTSCVSTPACYWNLDNANCQYLPFEISGDVCQKLKGQNSLECLSQTLECPISLNGFCQNRSHLETCQSYSNLQTCQNSVGQEGYCNYKNQQCQVLSSCTQIEAQHCDLMYKTCQWTSGTCTKLFCQSYLSSADCDYVYQSVNSRVIQLCQWNQTKKVCEAVTYALNKTQQNCYTSTGGLYHWSSNKQQNGYCITCQLNLIQPQRKCACNLLSEVECYLANPQCRWTSDSCVQSSCTTIYDSINCSKLSKCMWSAGLCIDFTNCANLSGANSFECLAQSSQCGFSNGLICQPSSQLQTCDKQYSTISTCIFGVKGSDGFCVWNSKSSACSLLQSCNQITVPTQCQSLINTCKWSTYFNNCVPFECQDLLSIEACTHVNVNLQNTGVELCEWRNGVCQPYDGKYFRYDEEICYLNSEQTYRWIGDDKQGVRCQQCSYSLLYQVLFIYLLIQVQF